MKRVTLGVLALLCIGVATVWNGSSRAQGPADSTSAVPPDSLASSTVRSGTPIPTLPPAPDSILVVLTTGSVLRYARVEPWPGGFVRAFRSDGTFEHLPSDDVRRIGTEGNDWTEEVLERREAIGTRPAVRPVVVPKLRGRPLPAKKGFPLLQAGALGRLDDHPNDETELVAAFDFGVMENRSPRRSRGVSLGVVTDGDYTRVSLKPRLRVWFGETLSLDVAAGPFLPIDSKDSPASHGPVGFVGDVSFTLGDWVSLTSLVEVVEAENPRNLYGAGTVSTGSETDVSYYLGAKAGGEMSFVVMGLMLLSALAYVSAR
ncbi:MAG TPA: hypothetical protein VFP58_00385 [Candidatus Eisenbacteria bacterium]|nr:hypothetical protein [Candidatus Eisenbacteria bacterium]